MLWLWAPLVLPTLDICTSTHAAVPSCLSRLLLHLHKELSGTLQAALRRAAASGPHKNPVYIPTPWSDFSSLPPWSGNSHCMESSWCVVIKVCGHHGVWSSSRCVVIIKLCGHQNLWSLRLWSTRYVVIKVCGHHGVCSSWCVVIGMWSSRCVVIEVCDHQSLWSSRYMVIKACGHRGCGYQGVWSSRCMVIEVCGHQILWSSRCMVIEVCAHQGVWSYVSLSFTWHLLSWLSLSLVVTPNWITQWKS